MTALISTMSFKGLLRQSSHDSCIPDGSLRNKGSLWHRRSLGRESNSKHQQNLLSSLGTLPRVQKQFARSRSNSLVDYTDPQRTTVVLEKQDNETFGFDVQTYGLQNKDSNTVEMCTFVCKVQEDSPAERAGLTTGDVIVRISGICIEGSAHQHIVDLIRESTNLLKMETVSGTVVKRIELEKKLRLLKESLRAKWVELQKLTLQEQRLICGNMNDISPRPSLDSPMSLASPMGWPGHRFSSDSSCRSVGTEDGEDGGAPLPPVFEDLSPFSPCPLSGADGGGCFFSQDFLPEAHPPLGRSRSTSLTSSGGTLSPTRDLAAALSPFGTLPRKSRRGSVRKHIMKFIPGLNHSVEEEENG
ncbi:cytohesin-interacting protein-like [Megalops cyprinoides]|uniref:cytohesin-interacting protein-like n=1 Tax=Megalops cyprinoides TaxID=118141 RepID=UPI001864E85E|nr:cytohesin-interacting protein-like [Megalops cyprinoides]